MNPCSSRPECNVNPGGTWRSLLRTQGFPGRVLLRRGFSYGSPIYMAVFFVVVSLILMSCATSHTSRKEDEAVNSLEQFRETLSKGEKGTSLSMLGPGDEVRVSVWRQDSLNRSFAVPPDGWVSFPLVGDLKVIGLTPVELREQLTLRLKKYYSDPQIAVDITAARSKRLYVLGEVNRPGVVNISSPISAVEAIAQAGGFTIDAKESSVLLVKGQGGKQALVSALDLKSAIREGTSGQNPLLDSGDVLYVSPSKIASVERFFRRIYPVVTSIVEMERGLVLQPLVDDVFRGNTSGSAIIVR